MAFIDRLSVLDGQFETVFVPEQVWDEVLEGEDGKDSIQNLRDSIFEVVGVDEDSFYQELRMELDKGESACITYALNHGIDLVLLDEAEGRRKAKNHGLDVTGVIGLLMNEGLEMSEELDKLRENGFWISNSLYDKIIDSVN